MLLKKEEVVKVFQNIDETENTKEEKAIRNNIFANIFSKKYILLYIITFMISLTPMGYNFSPFAFAIISACISNEIPIIAITIFAIIANGISTGISGTILFSITLLLFFISFLLKEPKYNEETKNEKIILSRRIFITLLIVNITFIIINQFLIYDLILAISGAIITVIFYKIFANSLGVLINYNEKMAFSIEEVLGTSLLFAISLSCLGNLSLFGFSIRNVLSIFIVLVLGWKNGILIRNNSWSYNWSNTWSYSKL